MQCSFFKGLRWLVTIFFMLSVATGMAQIYPLRVQTTLLPPYPTSLADLQSHPERIIINIINSNAAQNISYGVRLSVSLTGDNGIDMRTRPNYQQPASIFIPPGVTRLSAADVSALFNPATLNIKGITPNDLIKQNGFAEGIYQVCVR